MTSLGCTATAGGAAAFLLPWTAPINFARAAERCRNVPGV